MYAKKLYTQHSPLTSTQLQLDCNGGKSTIHIPKLINKFLRNYHDKLVIIS